MEQFIALLGTYRKYLDLSTNAFEGIIPSDIGRLTSLRYLDLNYNDNLYGAIPYQISNLQKLRYLAHDQIGNTSWFCHPLGNRSTKSTDLIINARVKDLESL